ncbi:alpha-galactosidase [Actinoplanes sp. NPDC049596]|uniref:alpha-galactosidase n=1 Tax=unclassified Actinoplanes TaxID=2626549 RepID=UPI00343E3148
MSDGNATVLALNAAGVSFVLDTAGPTPSVLHWGAGLGMADGLRATAGAALLNSSPDAPRRFGVWPGEHENWAGTPAQAGHAAGEASTPRPRIVGVHHDIAEHGGVIAVEMVDEITAMRSTITYRLDSAGVLAVDLEVRRCAASVPYALDGLRALLPLPDRATELIDFTGAWCRERSPQHAPLGFGSHIRRARRGKPGHDSPFLLAGGTAGFGFAAGEVWAVHLAWSGDAEYLAERLPEGAGAFASVLGAGELLRPGEVMLAEGESYTAPTALFVWSGAGLDGLAERLHRRVRARPSHPSSPRPLTLNSWEAIYFDHDLGHLSDLVERASRVGVERVVLDDGWFRGRRNDSAGLGDWEVDAGVWPGGLGPLVDLVRSHGMQFGLWVEPEMTNLDSELARAHPDWILGPRQGLGDSSRNQYAIDIARPEVYEHILERVSSLVSAYDIDYLKWDHNRDLSEAVGRRGSADRPAVHEQTVALYRMLDELKARHPALEIESCSAGGARIDLGILDRTDRVWASDCNDPIERLRVERWTRMLLPPELIGSHVGAARSHTTSRITDLSFRLAVALTAHAGIEWDLRQADEADLMRIAAWAGLYRELRGLIHTGRVVNADLADDATMLTGIIAQDGSRALFTWARLATSVAAQPGRVRFPGLDPAVCYRVRVRREIGDAARHSRADPAWVDAAALGTELPGTVLATAGVPLPALAPAQAMLFDICRVP